MIDFGLPDFDVTSISRILALQAYLENLGYICISRAKAVELRKNSSQYILRDQKKFLLYNLSPGRSGYRSSFKVLRRHCNG